MGEECCYVSKSGLVGANTESPEELCQDKQGTSPFYSFWQSSLWTWLSPVHRVGGINLFFLPVPCVLCFLWEWMLEASQVTLALIPAAKLGPTNSRLSPFSAGSRKLQIGALLPKEVRMFGWNPCLYLAQAKKPHLFFPQPSLQEENSRLTHHLSLSLFLALHP